jgi:sulfate transport system substrate-binding protein
MSCRTATLRGLAVVLLVAALSVRAETPTLLNVSYDPTRELYRDLNDAFAADWQARHGERPRIRMSHGGSGRQARAVIDGLKASVVTLALGYDIDQIAAAGMIAPDWQSRLPERSSPYTSTIVFLVRAGNPKGIRDWDDLARTDVRVITPNPKTSGGARWNYLAAWAWAERLHAGDRVAVEDYMLRMLANVPVLDAGARGSTTTFAQRGIGDVLVTWENEAWLAKAQFARAGLEIVYPSISIRADPPVAVVDANVDAAGTRALAEAYLAFLYTAPAQAIIARHHFRPAQVDAADANRYPAIEMVDIDGAFGGWAMAHEAHFRDGASFDRIMADVAARR